MNKDNGAARGAGEGGGESMAALAADEASLDGQESNQQGSTKPQQLLWCQR